MKTLGVLRHAKSDDGQESARDFDRTLNAKGRCAAEAMGRHIGATASRLGLAHFDLLLASSAARVRETIDLAMAAMGEVAPNRREYDRRLYLAPADAIIELIGERGGDSEAVLLSGHNPGIEDLVLGLVPDNGRDPLRQMVEDKYPTGSFALIRLDIATWRELAGGTGRLDAMVRPRDLDPRLGPELVG